MLAEPQLRRRQGVDPRRTGVLAGLDAAVVLPHGREHQRGCYADHRGAGRRQRARHPGHRQRGRLEPSQQEAEGQQEIQVVQRVLEHRMRAQHRQPGQRRCSAGALGRIRPPQPRAHHAPQPCGKEHRDTGGADDAGLGEQIQHGVVRMQRHLDDDAQPRELFELCPAEFAPADAEPRMRDEHRPRVRPQRAARGDLVAGLQLRHGVEQRPPERLPRRLDGRLQQHQHRDQRRGGEHQPGGTAQAPASRCRRRWRILRRARQPGRDQRIAGGQPDMQHAGA